MEVFPVFWSRRAVQKLGQSVEKLYVCHIFQVKIALNQLVVRNVASELTQPRIHIGYDLRFPF